jgi:broad specificity phosphatase PhoE
MSTTTFYLIRHARKEGGEGWLPGRMLGVHITREGRAQAEELADALAGVPFRAIYCSDLERVHETARPLSERLGLPLQATDEIAEIDFGEWTGQMVDDLDGIDEWRRFNAFRSGTRAPGGELMLDVQARFVRKMIELQELHAGDTIALFSHGDPIRCAVAYFLGIPLDFFLRIRIDSASVSIIELADYGPRVCCVNQNVIGSSAQ